MNNAKNFPKIICLMGPTGVGKTKLAIELTQHFPCKIISVDSGMVYRGMDIGTAKPSATELALAPHALIDICDPIESYSAGRFREDALREIEAIVEQDEIPLLVGGTMLYFHVLQQGLSTLPRADAKVRDYLAAEALKNGVSTLHERLKKIDPTAALRIQPKDLQRIQRALEVYEITGKTLTDLQFENKSTPPLYDFINVALLPAAKAALHERISKRFAAMLESGFVAEVENLLERWKLSPDLPALRTVGYRQIYQYLQGKLTFAEMQERAIIATRQLAKRQMTWLRSWANLKCFDNDSNDIYNRIAIVASL